MQIGSRQSFHFCRDFSMRRRKSRSIHVAKIERKYRGKTYATYLLRYTYREGGKVKHRTVGNLSHLPEDLIELIRRYLRGEAISQESCQIERSLPHGHVLATLGTLRKIGLESIVASRPCRERDLVTAMLVLRVVQPGSKLAAHRALEEQTATTSLVWQMGLGEVSEQEVYKALDWLLARKTRIETKLAKRHLSDGTLVLYDLSSSYYTGKRSELVQYGYSHDGKKRFPQIVYGVLCNGQGCPVAVEVFPGNTADSNTLASQIQKIRSRFGIRRLVWVGDRGMLTSRRIEEELRPIEGLDWITALRADTIKKLASEGAIHRALFDEQDLAEIRSPDFPGERLIVCRNRLLAEQRRRTRDELLEATRKKLDLIVEATRRAKRPLRGTVHIQRRVDRVLDRYQVRKHFTIEITDTSFSYQIHEQSVAEEAALDGIYVIGTSVEAKRMTGPQVVQAYKSLSKVERAFRCLKSVDRKIRPIYHWLADRMRAHVFLCMLAYYVEWHMRQKLAPILFDDDQRQAAEAQRRSVVQKAPRSQVARQKEATKRTADALPVHSFQSLLEHLGTLTENRVRIPQTTAYYYMHSLPTAVQARALELLGISL